MSAYVTVTDAAGRVLFRRPATAAEIQEAIQVADAADAEAQVVLKRILAEREANLAAIAEEERHHAPRSAPKVVTPIIKSTADTNSEASEEAAEGEAVEEDPHQEFAAEEPPFGFPVAHHDHGDHDL